jgi:diacylglycerol kinase family enzyme
MPEADFVPLKSIEEANALARSASGYETIVACGGDGTINAVADGVMANPDSRLRFGVIYMGTSPDFCRFHDIPTGMDEAIALLQNGFCKEIPVLQANGHCFFCSCNLGMGADIATLANRIRPVLGDKPGTFLAVMRNLLKNRKWDLTVNGEPLHGCQHFLVSRNSFIASGLQISLPPLDDDAIALWLVRGLSVSGWLRLISKLYKGLPCGELRIVKGPLTITAGVPVNIEFDGDAHGQLPLRIAFAPRRLRLVTRNPMG